MEPRFQAEQFVGNAALLPAAAAVSQSGASGPTSLRPIVATCHRRSAVISANRRKQFIFLFFFAASGPRANEMQQKETWRASGGLRISSSCVKSGSGPRV
ncbi:hypothetical protein F2P81_025781 [Scophthalmus maximus]|uniref:Uncharacterized protein n=1 Tax=Scophthalmus maximus TaxID=52904 RepID=A0A6A4RHL4_SCOMX|nr:hypothetical protein F2P81_025781 [Scophthalmus maximus]